jgi:fatty acid desaturase
MPYFPWRSIHFLHHKWVGVVDKDPTQAHLLKLRRLSAPARLLFRVCWKCLLPVPYVKYIIDVFWGYPARLIRNGDAVEGLKGIISIVVCVAPHAALVAGLGPMRYVVLFAPMLVIYYVIFEMVNLPQHGGIFPHLSSAHPNSIPLCEQDAITRSAWLPGPLGALLFYNFNLHTEHHLFPTVPWYSLPLVTKKVAEADGVAYLKVGMINFTVESRRRDPIELYVNSLPREEQA